MVDPWGGPDGKDKLMARDHTVLRLLGAFLGVAACASLFTAAASAQIAPPSEVAPDGRLEALVHTISDGVSCSTGNQRDGLDERSRKSGASQADIGAALAIISSSGDVCAPVRIAASAMSVELLARQAAAFQASQSTDAASSTSAATQAGLANAAVEAEARAASTRFSVGPPPRNLTRGRIAGL